MKTSDTINRRIIALQGFINDQFYNTIQFCLKLPYGGEALIEQMLRELAVYHTEQSLNSPLFLESHDLPDKFHSAQEALTFVVDLHIKEHIMENDWIKIEKGQDSFSVHYKKDKCFYYDHCNTLICYGYKCICVRRFFYEGIIRRLTGEYYQSNLLTPTLDEDYCSFEYKKSVQTRDEKKIIAKKIIHSVEDNIKLQEAVKVRTEQLEKKTQTLTREITEHKITEKKLIKAKESLKKAHDLLEERVQKRTLQLEEANKDLEAFNYSVSHDLRAPLRQILSFSKFIKDETESHPSEKIDEYANLLIDSSATMNKLITDLLDFSKSCKSDLKIKKFNLNQLIQEILDDLKEETQGREINWRIDTFSEIDGDPVMLKMAWTNLISNGLKYTRKKNKAIIEIGNFDSDTGEKVYYIKDNGAGFDMAFSSKIFDSFQRLHGDDEFEGSGIGLSSVRRIVERHCGEIWAESEPDKGATFYFTLPLCNSKKDCH